MRHDKAIASGKEHRKQYHDCQSFDYSCRHQGGCVWCQSKRQRWRKKLKEAERADRTEG